ncbi:nucleotidyltransferase domain-containing protein [Leptolyngbya cf. ectocarpi LEGE 11479]|uniref:Nucleotidyltransferase domain-containing protein n=1 Tax=Leptolyngbya cf. ectocarpi LEGE 11479 TaxID=1828722 RepID=A0A928ZTV5_LEPEC|nr:nucleotidyltransferase domain-containing protein [Leptolyngbya ectocarpi]MBE9067351.1 nucleotidyltransferase domain-containing protein [Leptolyngbya cf. ectocarpi LEGE 11479]
MFAEASTAENSRDLLSKISSIIVEAVEPVQIVLFGSRATGRARPDSDYDLLVIEAEPYGPGHSRRQQATKLWVALSTLGISTDILMYSQAEISQYKEWRNHVVAHAFREGQILYERPERS